MSDEPQTTDPPPNVESDTTCLGCGYNLRGLDPTGRCPECGAAVEHSIHGNLIRYAEPTWVDRITRGVRWIYYSVYTAVLAVLIVFITMVALAVAAPDTIAGMQTGIIGTLAGIPMIAVVIVYPLGWWWATGRDPAEDERGATERMSLRVSAILFMPVGMFWRPEVLGWTTLPALVAVVTELWTHMCFGLVWVHIVLVARMFTRLYRRCEPESAERDRKAVRLLRKTERYAIWVPVALLAIHWILVAIIEIGGSRGRAVPFRGGFGSGVGPVVMFFLWLSVISAGGTVLRAVKRERLVSLGLREGSPNARNIAVASTSKKS